MTYCNSTVCPYTDCERHPEQLKGQVGVRSFANLEGVCRKYIRWVAYSNYDKYAKLKELEG